MKCPAQLHRIIQLKILARFYRILGMKCPFGLYRIFVNITVYIVMINKWIARLCVFISSTMCYSMTPWKIRLRLKSETG